jgi:hypothetical protein
MKQTIQKRTILYKMHDDQKYQKHCRCIQRIVATTLDIL